MKNKKFWLTNLIVILLVAIVGFAYKPVLNDINYGLDLKGGFEVLYKVDPLGKGEKLTDDMMSATYKSIQNRVDSLGVSEPEISIEGDKIRVKLAGVTNEEEARERLSTPAVLSFRDTSDNLLMNSSVLGSPAARLDYNSNREPVVALKIADVDKFYSVTKKISTSSDNRIVIWLDYEDNVDSFKNEEATCGVDGNMSCISVASVNEAFASDVVIEGSFEAEEAEELVDLINSGSLPTKLTEVSTKTVDASFGSDTLGVAAIAGVIVMILIVIMMSVVYRFAGFISGVCVFIYSFLVFLIYNLIDGVLTLPGIAALILGIGMAVDASIISFERVKDELKRGRNLETAEKEGNKRSLITIIDANITTFIVAVVLFIFGESSVKGFATLLMITIILTILTMVIVNRLIVKEYVKSKFFDNKITAFIGLNKNKIVKLGSKEEPKDSFEKIDFVKHKKVWFTISALILVVGLFFGVAKGMNLGIDFTGGTDITLKASDIDMNEAKEIMSDYDIVEFEKVSENEAYIKITDTLTKNEINDIKSDFEKQEVSADITVISNLVKQDLLKNAIISVIIASLGILIYIAFRFTWNYALGAIISLLHDVFFVLAMFAIFRIEINFMFIAAILTIIGYSINDTIVSFDRIRENSKKYYNDKPKTKEELENLVNRSIRQTFFRSLYTSITTITAVVVLILAGASEILNFNLALLFGLVIGVYSSIFIAAQIWLILEVKGLGKTKKKPKYIDDELDEKEIKGINS